jgi:hypothetical protein
MRAKITDSAPQRSRIQGPKSATASAPRAMMMPGSATNKTMRGITDIPNDGRFGVPKIVLFNLLLKSTIDNLYG